MCLQISSWLVTRLLTGTATAFGSRVATGERLMTMMPVVAENAPELRLGRVDATEHNGLARTFGVRRFPTVLLFDEGGDFFEFPPQGGRSPPRLVAFGRGAPGMLAGGQRAPTELSPNVSELWLLLEASYEPLKVAIKWAVLIALGIKGLSLALLKCLERLAGRRINEPRRKPGAAASGDEDVDDDASSSEADDAAAPGPGAPSGDNAGGAAGAPQRRKAGSGGRAKRAGSTKRD